MKKRMLFITGASSGIGRALAEAACDAGYSVFATARRLQKLKELASSLKKQNPKADIYVAPLDVRDASAVKNFAKKHSKTLSNVSVLVNNAGLARGVDSLGEPLPDDWVEKCDEMIDTNVKGLLWVSRVLLPTLIRNRGHIVNIGSVAGRWVYPRGNVYCATKFAVKALTEAMRQDLHGTGVRVTEIAPGMVETEFSLVRLKNAAKAKSLYKGMRPLTARDVAETVLWCIQRPNHVNIQDLTIFPTDQATVTMVHRNC